MDVHAVVVAGGAGSRLAASAPDGTPAKPLLVGRDGVRLIDVVLDAAAQVGCTRRVVVAQAMDLPQDVTLVREDPPLSGPAAAVATGVDALGDAPGDAVFLLAGDLVAPAAAMARLLETYRRTGGDGCIAVVDGRRQPLLALVRLDRLRATITGDLRDAPVRAVLRGLDLAEVGEADGIDAATAADVDTWEDAVEHGYGGERS
ncbi:molybdenum cofactor guanylyltransferase [Corynebacterium sp. AOP40-9SA-29]|uniref:molybdenum cofactor guanylyltransferase n=1 Tax=Corynebacterium sp. AOP40-9SA-29 TaxID=3457677 RepID=UPI0040334A28